MKKKVVVVGSGGHAKVAIDIINKNEEYEIIGCLDKNYKDRNHILGYEVIGSDELISILYKQGINNAFIALGDNHLRYKLYEKLINNNFKIINAISKNAYISDSVKLGTGVIIMPGAVINADAQIGNNVIINTKACIDHDCIIGDHCHIAPGSSISGYVNIGEGTFVGTGSSIKDRINIGNWCIVGVGSAVVKDIPSYSLAYGVPAQVRRNI